MRNKWRLLFLRGGICPPVHFQPVGFTRLRSSDNFHFSLFLHGWFSNSRHRGNGNISCIHESLKTGKIKSYFKNKIFFPTPNPSFRLYVWFSQAFEGARTMECSGSQLSCSIVKCEAGTDSHNGQL